MPVARAVNAVYEAGVNAVNEDALLVRSDLFAVFDGATGLVPYKNDEGETGGSIAASIAAQAFSAAGGSSLAAVAKEANDRLRRRMASDRVDLSQSEGLWATAVAAVRLRASTIEYFTIGNALVLAISDGGQCRLLTPHVNHDAETLVQWQRLAQEGVSDIAGKMRGELIKVRREANRTYGYLNGEPEAVEFFRHGWETTVGIESLVLFTDGLHVPTEDPGGTESWDAFVEVFRQAGLPGLLRHVRELERSDPRCERYPRFKRHDDIAAIAVELGTG